MLKVLLARIYFSRALEAGAPPSSQHLEQVRPGVEVPASSARRFPASRAVAGNGPGARASTPRETVLFAEESLPIRGRVYNERGPFAVTGPSFRLQGRRRLRFRGRSFTARSGPVSAGRDAAGEGVR